MIRVQSLILFNLTRVNYVQTNVHRTVIHRTMTVVYFLEMSMRLFHSNIDERTEMTIYMTFFLLMYKYRLIIEYEYKTMANENVAYYSMLLYSIDT
jgi:hypothetical protein